MKLNAALLDSLAADKRLWDRKLRVDTIVVEAGQYLPDRRRPGEAGDAHPRPASRRDQAAWGGQPGGVSGPLDLGGAWPVRRLRVRDSSRVRHPAEVEQMARARGEGRQVGRSKRDPRGDHLC